MEEVGRGGRGPCHRYLGPAECRTWILPSRQALESHGRVVRA